MLASSVVLLYGPFVRRAVSAGADKPDRLYTIQVSPGERNEEPLRVSVIHTEGGMQLSPQSLDETNTQQCVPDRQRRGEARVDDAQTDEFGKRRQKLEKHCLYQPRLVNASRPKRRCIPYS